MSPIGQIQAILGVPSDGIWGPLSQGALDDLIKEGGGWHSTTATSFADPADVAAFKRCKAEGKTDHECFAVGDNGIGFWGDSTVQGTGACCALPNSAWGSFINPSKKSVLVEVGGASTVCELRDTSGSRDVVDLNPDACKNLGLTPPVKTPARWRWADVA